MLFAPAVGSNRLSLHCNSRPATVRPGKGCRTRSFNSDDPAQTSIAARATWCIANPLAREGTRFNRQRRTRPVGEWELKLLLFPNDHSINESFQIGLI